MKSSILKPGLLVSLHTRISGGISYSRIDIEPERTDETGKRRATWQTSKQISDAAEYDAAVTARGKARGAITAVCVHSAFGLLCPADDEAKLDAALKEARAIARAHNEGARLSFVRLDMLTGRIAQTDEEAARAIGTEVKELLEEMQAGIAAADPERIREAASKARQLEAMLSEETAGKVSEAVEEARGAARAIVKRIQNGGEQAAKVVAELSLKKLEGARFAFLDFETVNDVQPVKPAAVDLDIPPALASADPDATIRMPMLALEGGSTNAL